MPGIRDQGVRYHEATDLTVRAHATERNTSMEGDFESLRAEVEWHRRLERGDSAIRTVTRTELTCTGTAFLLRAELDAYERVGDSERRVFCRSWDERIPRDLV